MSLAIVQFFGDCVDSGLKLVGFVVGCISLLLWLVPLFPQLYANYRNQRCEGLSIYFLLFWMIGDACNMLGAVLADQQPFQKIIGVYYLLQDMVLLGQFTYYSLKIRARRNASLEWESTRHNNFRSNNGRLHNRGSIPSSGHGRLIFQFHRSSIIRGIV